MVGHTHTSAESRVVRIEPDERLVVLARTMQVQAPGFETAWKDGASGWAAFGECYLGRALYRHRSVFRSASDVPVWSHLELSYFRGIVPAVAIQDLVFGPQSADAHLLRAEILLTTPSSFVMPRDRRGSMDRPGRRTSLEYIHVRPGCLEKYRDLMRRFIGPAAADLVSMGRIGTFRAMETAAVLYRDPSSDIDWNQLHLSEVDADGFKGFGQEFDAALRGISPGDGSTGLFAGLDQLRSIPRWTFNDPVMEADHAVARSRSAAPPSG